MTDITEAPGGQQQPSRRRHVRWAFIAVAVAIAAVIGAVVLLTADGSGALTASRACGNLNKKGITIAQGDGIVANAVNHGITIPELQAECAGLMNAVGMGSLRDGVTTQISFCDQTGIAGTVVNNNDTTVDVTLRYRLLSAAGIVRHDGDIVTNAVRPGQTGTWNEPVNVEYVKCDVATSTVRATP